MKTQQHPAAANPSRQPVRSQPVETVPELPRILQLDPTAHKRRVTLNDILAVGFVVCSTVFAGLFAIHVLYPAMRTLVK